MALGHGRAARQGGGGRSGGGGGTRRDRRAYGRGADVADIDADTSADTSRDLFDEMPFAMDETLDDPDGLDAYVTKI